MLQATGCQILTNINPLFECYSFYCRPAYIQENGFRMCARANVVRLSLIYFVFFLFFGRVSSVRTVPATEVELTVYKCLGDRHRWPHRPSSSLDVGTRGGRLGCVPVGCRTDKDLSPRWEATEIHTNIQNVYIFSYGRINSTTRPNRPVIVLCSSARNM